MGIAEGGTSRACRWSECGRDRRGAEGRRIGPAWTWRMTKRSGGDGASGDGGGDDGGGDGGEVEPRKGGGSWKGGRRFGGLSRSRRAKRTMWKRSGAGTARGDGARCGGGDGAETGGGFPPAAGTKTERVFLKCPQALLALGGRFRNPLRVGCRMIGCRSGTADEAAASDWPNS